MSRFTERLEWIETLGLRAHEELTANVIAVVEEYRDDNPGATFEQLVTRLATATGPR